MRELLTSTKAWLVTAALVTLAVIWLAPFACAAWRRFRRQGLAFTLIALGFLYCAATKSAFSFESGLANNGSYSTNSTVRVAWRTTSVIPSATKVYIEYKDKSITNDVYHSLAETTVGAGSWQTDAFANATNYDFNIWYYYIPPSPVHTNGVWSYNTMSARDSRFVLPLRATVREDNTILSPPKQKKDNQNE